MSQIVHPQLDDPATPDREWVAKGFDRWAKVRVANQARLLVDNQRTLNTANAADRARRDLAHRMEEWSFDRFKKRHPTGEPMHDPKTGGITYPEDDEMAINIDSPTTINNTYQSPASSPGVPTSSPPASSSTTGLPNWVKAAVGTALLASGIGMGTGITAYLNSGGGDTTIVQPVQPGEGFGVGLLPPAKPTPEGGP